MTRSPKTALPKAADTLVAWMSDQISGSWPTFRNVVAHLQSDPERTRPLAPAVFLARDLRILSFAEFEPGDLSWRVLPPQIFVPENGAVSAYLRGWRSAPFLDRVSREADRLGIYFDEIAGIPNVRQPSRYILKASDPEALVQLAETTAISLSWGRYLSVVSEQFVPATAGRAFPPSGDEQLEVFDLNTLGWVFVDRCDDPDRLYRYRQHGRYKYLFHDGGDSLVLMSDKASGQNLVLRDTGFALTSIRSGRFGSRDLAVPSAVDLPIDVERMLVSSSGLLPQIVRSRRVFFNIPWDKATLIAAYLGYEVESES